MPTSSFTGIGPPVLLTSAGNRLYSESSILLTPPDCSAPLTQAAQFIDKLIIEPVGRFTGERFVYEGNDCRGFSGELDMASEPHRERAGLTAGGCGAFLVGRFGAEVPEADRPEG